MKTFVVLHYISFQNEYCVIILDVSFDLVDWGNEVSNVYRNKIQIYQVITHLGQFVGTKKSRGMW